MRAIVIGLVLATCAVPAIADHIGLYDTPTASLCVGPPPTALVPVSLYIVHEVSVGAVGSRWSVSNGVAQFVSLGYTCGGVSISGDPADGVMVGYGGCVASPHSACRLDYMKLTGDPIVGCYHMRVEPFPGDSDVLVTDCAMVDKAATGGYFSFELPPHSCDDCAVGIEATTWGSVKALYR